MKTKRVDHPYNCGNCKRWKKTGKIVKGHLMGICGRSGFEKENWNYCVGVEQRKKSRI